MLYFVSRIGSNYGVIDTDDGVISWITEKELLDFAKQVEIVGVKEMKPTSCIVESGKCNWSKGKNIFTSLKDIKIDNYDKFVITTVDAKKYKGKIVKSLNGVSGLLFTCNVFVPISEFVFRLMHFSTNNNHSQLVEKLKTSGGQSLR